MLGQVRLITSFANLLVVVTLTAGGPQWYALEAGASVCVLCSAQETVGVEALTPDRGPAESRASRDGGRSQVMTAWKSVHFHPAILPAGVIRHSAGFSTPFGRAVAPLRPLAASSPRSVRGPPVAL